MMIVTLSAASHKQIADDIAQKLRNDFQGRVEIVYNDPVTPAPWPADPDWDDLLVVIFDGTPFPSAGCGFIEKFLAERKGKGLILPVALDEGHSRPPSPSETIKAFPFGTRNATTLKRLSERVGAMIGLRSCHRGTKIFISYRATDGTNIAVQLEEKLRELGYPVWRDEAKEVDGETKILPGTAVQQQIDEGLSDANVVLLLDTQQAPASYWIKHEVDTANGLLVPILPICFRRTGDPKKGPRFKSLLDLQRWLDVSLDDHTLDSPLNENDIDTIIAAMEQFVCEMFRRKCRVPFIVEKEFVSRAYTWKIMDHRRLMCESIREHSYRSVTKIFSHCSIFEQVHGSAVDAFSKFLQSAGRSNHALFIYDGELIPEPELRDVIKSMPAGDGVVILHHQELAALIESNFTTFTP